MSLFISAERAEEVQRLFDAVADLPTDELAIYLDRHCADEALRLKVELLLNAVDDPAEGARHSLKHFHRAAREESMPDNFDLTGRTVSRYRVQEKLGSGGMGVVYRARDSKLGRTVALKFLPRQLGLDEEAKLRFVHEAKAASALDHVNICTVHDVDQTEDGRLFIAMAFYQGETLEKKIKQGQMPVDAALDFVVKIAEGLKRAHDAGIVHRDIKPANVMVTDQGVVKILDFGLAKVAGIDLTTTGTVLGTVAYMSPEQVQGEPVDHRTDIWSLGVVLYELLTGQRPFKGDYAQAVLYAIQLVAPVPVNDVRPGLPPRLSRILDRMLEKQRDRRYQHIDELLADLEDILGEDKPGAAELANAHSPNRAGLFDGITSPTLKPSAYPSIRLKIPPTDTEDRRNLLVLLRKVQKFWIEGVLEHAIHTQALISLRKETRPEAVAHPWERVMELPHETGRTLAPDQPLGEVFEDVGRSLLILGAPGSGKTITLLRLTRDLIARAENDDAHAVPVVFNLSSLGNPRAGLRGWLADELGKKYQIPRKLALKWLEESRLILLLDGLDEVLPEQRTACVAAINSFAEEYGVPGMAICSRLDDYMGLPLRLNLYSAVCLQPLSKEQIIALVKQTGPSLAGLHTALKTDRVLFDLAQTPLMLDIMCLAYQNLTADALGSGPLDTTESRQYQLFETYIQRMLRRKGSDVARYPKEQILGWLSWLARGLRDHGQTVFLIEQLQPSWLSSRTERWAYVVGSRLAGGLALGLLFSLFSGLFFGLVFGSTIGLAIGIVDASRLRRHSLWNWMEQGPKWWQISVNVTMVGAIVGILSGFAFALRMPDPGTGLLYGLTFGLGGGLIAGTRGSGKSMTSDIHTVESLRWSWVRARTGALSGLLIGLSLGLACGMIIELTMEAAAGFQWSLIFPGGLLGVLAGAVFGGLGNRTLELKAIPNQGITLSARSAMLGGLALGIVAIMPVLASVFLMPIISGQEIRTAAGYVVRSRTFLGFLFVIGLAAGSFWYGGLDVIQHYILRLILYHRGYTPRRYARFLDYADKLILLRKVGGGYIFIHRLLQEHFAVRIEDDS